MNTFGTRLRQLRRERSASLDEVALAVGTVKSTLSKYENGKQEPSLEIACKLAGYFMTSLDWLAGVDGTDEVVRRIPNDYIDVIYSAVNKNIPADKLMKAIELISG